MRDFRRMLSLCLVCCLLINIFPVSAISSPNMMYSLGENEEIVLNSEVVSNAPADIASGTCGDNLTWTLTTDGTLTIVGTGAMNDFSYYTSPWYDHCEAITSVVIEPGVTSIGTFAFYNCSELMNAEIPDSVLSIGNYAFSVCTSLSNIYIPEGVTSIGAQAFVSCSGLESISLPDSITFIDALAFGACTSLSSIQIPNGMTRLSYTLFDGCTALVSVTIPASITVIGEAAFRGCEKLKDIHYLGSDTQWESLSIQGDNDFLLSADMHYSRIDAAGIVLDRSALTLAPEETVTLSATVYPENATDKSVTWTSSDESIATVANGVVTAVAEGETVITAATANNVYTVSCDVTVISSVVDDGNVVVSGTCGGEGDGTNLTWMLTSDGTLIISGTGVMADYSATDVAPWSSYTDSIKRVIMNEGVSTVGADTFRDCKNLVFVEIPDTVTSIGRNAFVSCSSLSAVDIPESVSSIGVAAFRNCLSLTNIEIPSKITLIEKEVFSYTGLTNVSIPSGVAIIADHAFEGCHSLKSIGIPKSVVQLESYAFYCCCSLSDVYYTGTKEQWEQVEIGESNGYLTSAAVHYEILPKPAVEDFEPAIYRAIYLYNDAGPSVQNINKILSEATPCEILTDSLQEAGFDKSYDAWKLFDTISDALSDITSVAECFAEPKDLYSAVILNALEASVTYDSISDDIEEKLKLCDDFINTLNGLLKPQVDIDLRNEMHFKNLNGDIKKFFIKNTKEWFKDEYPVLSEMDSVFGKISTALDVTSDVEDFFKRIVTACHVAQTNEYMKEVIKELYEDSQEVDENGQGLYPNSPVINTANSAALKLALQDCVEIMDSSTEDLIQRIIIGEVAVAGTKVAKHLIKEWWKGVTLTLYVTHPYVAIFHAAYKAGKFVTNVAINMDDQVEQYLKMLAILDVEYVFDRTYQDLRESFAAQQDVRSASVYLNALDFMFQLRDEDTVRAYGHVDILDKTLVNQICKIYGSDSYGDLKEFLSLRQKTYYHYHELALIFWIYYLEEDYPNSGLYESYEYLIEESVERRSSKEYVAACPIDVYVYDESDQLVASIVNGRVRCDGNITVALSGDRKIVRFYDDQNYRIEYVGTDVGEMDVTISEYNEMGESVRTINYYDVALECGETYYTDVTEEILSANPYVLVNEGNQTVVESDYDSLLTNGEKFQVSVQGGSLLQNGEIFFTTSASSGETLEINVLVPDGYRFSHWQVLGGSVRIENETSAVTTFVMPEFDVEIHAVLEAAIPVTGVALSAEDITLTEVGETATLTAIITPEDTTNKTVTWTSNDPSVATVSDTGVVTAVANGTTTITVTTEDGGFTAHCTVEVKVPIAYTVTYNVNDGSGGVTTDTVTEGEEYTIAAAPVREGYTFTGWNTKADGTGTIYAAGSSLSIESDLVLFAQWVSANVGVNGVTVNGVSAVKDGTRFVVVLPCTTEMLPTSADAIQINLSDSNASVTDLVTSDMGATWSFTVIAADGITRNTYTISVSIAENPAAENNAVLAVLKSTLENNEWSVAQEIANTEVTVQAWITEQTRTLVQNNAEFTIDVTVVNPAVAGNLSDLDGTNGSFSFKATLTKGTGESFATITTEIITGEIDATDYVPVKYTVSFDKNGGLGEMESIVVTENTAYTLPECGFNAPSGQQFKAWSICDKEYSENAVYVVSADTLVIAIWEVIDEPSIPDDPDEPEPPDEPEIPDRPVIPDFPIIPSIPSVPSTETVTVRNEDRSVTTIVTDKKTGIVTATTRYSDGTVLVIVTIADGERQINVTVPVGVTAKVTIPVENMTMGTVAVIVHKDGTEEIVQYSIPSENGLVVTLSESAQLKIIDNARTFSDVADNAWFKDAVDFVSARGIMNGIGNDVFSHGGTTTRAMVWTMLARLSGIDTSGGASWYEKGLAWAMENGISDGTNANGEITREQLAVMLWRLSGSPKAADSSLAALSGYTDGENTSGYAQQAMAWAISNGIISGMGNGILNPGGNATRAQVAQILMNFMC